MADPMPAHPGALPPRSTAVLLALCAALLLLRLGAVPLLGPDEPRYSRVAVEMARSGDLVTPTLQGQPWLEKPVLFYWLAAAAFRALGENETAARLPAVLATLLLVGSTALCGARLYGAGAGLFAGFVCGTSLLTFAYGRAASMDMLLAAPVTAAIGLLALRLLGIAGRFAVPAAWLLMGVATLAKGPLGVLLPVLVVVAWAAVRRDSAALRVALLSPSGWLLFLLVAGPWYALVLHAQGWAFVDTFLLGHNLQRFTSTIHRHPGPVYYYLPVLFAGLFPWSGLLVPAFREARPRETAADLFVIVWLCAPLAFFSVAGSKLPGYIVPCLPPLALLIGRAAHRLASGEAPPGIAARAAGLLTLALASVVAALPLVARLRGQPAANLVPLAAWSLVTGLGVSLRIARDPDAALRILRVGAPGLLLLLTSAAPAHLARTESGRALFLPAGGREVLAWGAWRTAWMAGYFYNDARVHEVDGFPEIAARLSEGGPVLVLCGPGEKRRLEQMSGLVLRVLAEGPRENALVRLDRR
jgi:4-amino-4-deoxy-L-arabinose transferase-like glycosyltransferase